jgi:hypothetical protein
MPLHQPIEARGGGTGDQQPDWTWQISCVRICQACRQYHEEIAIELELMGATVQELLALQRDAAERELTIIE